MNRYKHRIGALRLWLAAYLRKEWLSTLLLGAILGCAIVHSRRYADVPIDDAFVTYRHSLNLVQGRGYSCNPSVRIEGTSSALFAFLIAPIVGLGGNPYAFAILLGTAAFLAIVVIAYLVVRELVTSPWSRWFGLSAAALVASSAPLAYHSQTGMETTLFAALIMAAVWRYLTTALRGHSWTYWAAIMGIATMARTEALPYFAVWLLVSIASPWFPRPRLRQGGRALLVYGATYLPLVAFRLLYFGQPFPNSVVAKSGWYAPSILAGNFHSLVGIAKGDGTELMLRFANEHIFMFGTILGCLFVRRSACILFPSGLLLFGGAALVNWSGGDWMPYFRHLVPAIAPLCVAAVVGVSGVLFHEEQRGRYGHLPSVVIAALCLSFTIRANAAKTDTSGLVTWKVAALRKLGESLASVTNEGDWVVSDMAGILPYYWQANTIDIDGFCDAHIAHHGQAQRFGTGRALPEYIATRTPQWYVFEYPERVVKLYRDPAFLSHRDAYYMVQFPYGYLKRERESAPLPMFLVRKDQANPNRIKAALGSGVKLVDLGSELLRIGLIRADQGH